MSAASFSWGCNNIFLYIVIIVFFKKYGGHFFCIVQRDKDVKLLNKTIYHEWNHSVFKSEQGLICMTCFTWVRENQTDKKTLASSSSWSVLTPKRGTEVLERLELWDSFLTPLMWLIGLSFRVGDGISTSFCLSRDWWTNTNTQRRIYRFHLAKAVNADWTEIWFWSHSPRKVLEMYSDTWLPERLISDRWDSSLFSILLNCGREQNREISLFTLSLG